MASEMPPFKRELSIRAPVEDGWTIGDSQALIDLIADVTGLDGITVIEVYIDPA